MFAGDRRQKCCLRSCGLEPGQQEKCLQEPTQNRCQQEAKDAGGGAGGLRRGGLV